MSEFEVIGDIVERVIDGMRKFIFPNQDLQIGDRITIKNLPGVGIVTDISLQSLVKVRTPDGKEHTVGRGMVQKVDEHGFSVRPEGLCHDPLRDSTLQSE